MTNDKQERIFASKEEKNSGEAGGKNSKEADCIKLEGKTDIKNLKNIQNRKICRHKDYLHIRIRMDFKLILSIASIRIGSCIKKKFYLSSIFLNLW